MNFMRKVLGGGAGGPPGPGGGASSAIYQPEQELLGLNHLKKLYTEYSQPSAPLSSAEKVWKQIRLLF